MGLFQNLGALLLPFRIFQTKRDPLTSAYVQEKGRRKKKHSAFYNSIFKCQEVVTPIGSNEVFLFSVNFIYLHPFIFFLIG